MKRTLTIYFSEKDEWLLTWLRKEYTGSLSTIGRDIFYRLWETKTHRRAETQMPPEPEYTGTAQTETPYNGTPDTPEESKPRLTTDPARTMHQQTSPDSTATLTNVTNTAIRPASDERIENYYRKTFGDIEDDREFIHLLGNTAAAAAAVRNRLRTLRETRPLEEDAIIDLFKTRHKRLAEIAEIN